MNQLRLRALNRNDLDVVCGVHSTNCNYPLPDLNNKLYCCNKVVVDDKDNVIGVGMVRLTSESILMMDRTKPTTVRARAIKMLIREMKDEVASLGMDETHAFVEDSDAPLQRLLRKAFGFVVCSSRPLYLQFQGAKDAQGREETRR